MGLFRRKISDPVAGRLQVTSAKMPSTGAYSQSYRLKGVITAEGVPATAVESRGIVRTSKYPMPGRVLPVTVSRSDPTRFRIEWGQVETSDVRGTAGAEALAEAIRSGGGLVTSTSSQSIDARDIPGLRDEVMQMLSEGADHEAIAAHTLERLAEHGIPIGADAADVAVVPTAQPGEATAPPPPAAPTAAPGDDDDPEVRLQRLIELRDKGLIGYAEYDTLRARILDEL